MANETDSRNANVTPDAPWDRLRSLTAAGDGEELLAYLEHLEPLATIRALFRLSGEEQEQLVALLPAERAAEIIEDLPDVHAADLIERLNASAAAEIFEELDSDHGADLLAEIEAPRAPGDPRRNAARSRRQHAQLDHVRCGCRRRSDEHRVLCLSDRSDRRRLSRRSAPSDVTTSSNCRND